MRILSKNGEHADRINLCASIYCSSETRVTSEKFFSSFRLEKALLKLDSYLFHLSLSVSPGLVILLVVPKYKVYISVVQFYTILPRN